MLKNTELNIKSSMAKYFVSYINEWIVYLTNQDNKYLLKASYMLIIVPGIYDTTIDQIV